MKVVGAALEGSHIDIAFFEAVDFGIDPAQVFGGIGSEETRLGHLGHTLQQFGVNSALGGLEQESGIVDAAVRHFNDALLADGDGIDLDAHIGGDLCGLFGSDHTCIAIAIGEQHHDFAFGRGVLEAVKCGGHAITHSGFPFQDACPHVLDKLLNHALVGRERAVCKCFASKNHQSDTVIGAFFGETGGHGLRHGEAIGLEVSAEHTERDVHRQHDVDTIGIDALLLPGFLGPRQGDYTQGQGQVQ